MLGWDTFDSRTVGGLLLAAAAVHAVLATRHWLRREPALAVYFSPRGGCAAAVVAVVAAARSEVLVQAYSFSSPDIAAALAAAAKRRVRVVVLLDRSNEAESYSELGDLQSHGVEVWIDAAHAIAHNKVIVIDGRTVLTGSFNFTRQAEYENAENLLILRDHRDLAARYRANFHGHRDHCRAAGAGGPAHARTHEGQAQPAGPHGHR